MKNQRPHAVPLTATVLRFAEKVLGHTLQGIAKVYNVDDYLKKKRAAVAKGERRAAASGELLSRCFGSIASGERQMKYPWRQKRQLLSVWSK